MSKVSTKTRSAKISNRTRELYENARRQAGSLGPPPITTRSMGEGDGGKYYRPLKSQISFRIDNDVLDWLKSKGEGHLSRINALLRERMESERQEIANDRK